MTPTTVLGPQGAQGLDRMLAGAPAHHLGPDTAARFEERLPFLIKVLAADRPLSLQVHPDLTEAVAGYAQEERAGIPRSSPARAFRDTHPKPELLVAVTPFAALCGFRAPDHSGELLRSLALPGTEWLVTALAGADRSLLPQLTAQLLHLPPAEVQYLLEQIRLRGAQARSGRGPWGATLRWLHSLATAYPDDPGVLAALLLELFELAPGEALSVSPGTPHAYLEGVGVEIMAASDNVLRGGMTTKPVHVDLFVAHLDGRSSSAYPSAGRVARRTVARGHHRYLWPTPYFQLDAFTTDARATRLAPGVPRIVLCLEGDVHLTDARQHLRLGGGQAAFLSASGRGVDLRCSGTAMVAAPGAEPT